MASCYDGQQRPLRSLVVAGADAAVRSFARITSFVTAGPVAIPSATTSLTHRASRIAHHPSHIAISPISYGRMTTHRSITYLLSPFQTYTFFIVCLLPLLLLRIDPVRPPQLERNRTSKE